MTRLRSVALCAAAALVLVATASGNVRLQLGSDRAEGWGCAGPDFSQCAVPAGGTSGVLQVSAGKSHSLARKSDGSVIAWGCSGGSDFGQCAVPGGAASGVTAIDAGAFHSLALTSAGAVLAWGCAGSSDGGQCTVPPEASSGGTAIAAGEFHTLALKSGGVLAWGCDADYGQCTVPGSVGSGVTAIAAGSYHSLALKSDGSVVAWGCVGADFGQCAVPGSVGSGVTAIDAGAYHSLALKSDGSVVAWGCVGPNYGQCAVPGAATSGVTAIAAGEAHSLALKTGGTIVAWGCGGGRDFGQCTTPAAAGSGVTSIAAGDYHSLAIHPPPSSPAGSGAANPSTVVAGGSTTLTVAVTPGANPASSGLGVTADLTQIGGSASQTLYDDATNGDQVAGDKTFSYAATVASGTTAGSKSLPATITDAQARTGSATIALTVNAPPTAVALVFFTATRGPRGTLVRWRTGAGRRIVGFDLYRATGSRLVRLNRRPIAAAAAAHGTSSYSFVDRRAYAGESVYRLRSIGIDGSRAWLGAARSSSSRP